MIEVSFSYDFLENIDQQAYVSLAKRATNLMLKSPGFIEFRAQRNMLGSPHVRRSSVWNTLDDWARLAGSPAWQEINNEFRRFVTHLNVQIWGPSPHTPDPIRGS